MSVTCSTIGSYGRLGNALFQLAILISIREKLNYEILVPDQTHAIWDGQKSLLNCFNHTVKTLGNNDKFAYNFIETTEFQFKYNPKIWEIPDNTNIFGFFQNFGYYDFCWSTIQKELELKSEYLLPNIEKFNRIREQYKGYEIVSLHLRRGDSAGNMYDGNFTTSLWYQYFNRARNYFQDKKVKFIIFTGGIKGDDSDQSEYEWCKSVFIGDEFIILDEKRNPIDDFTLIQQCDHHILSPVSSFGYMAVALIKDKPNKIIVAPQNYHFLETSLGDDLFYPKEFILD